MTLPARPVLVSAAAALAVGVALVVVGLSPTGPPEPEPMDGAPPAVPAGAPHEPAAWGPPPDDGPHGPGRTAPADPRRLALTRSVPVSVDAPSIGVRADLRPVGLVADGSVEVPPARPPSVAGWYRYSASPGEAGTAVIVGHVDSARDGPAVFFRLGDLRPGDPISVRRADGVVVRFRVTAVREYTKHDFPSALVYGSSTTPQLRLVTCGGPFDAAVGSYEDSVVVFAAM